MNGQTQQKEDGRGAVCISHPGNQTGMIEVTLIRHGETDMNAAGVFLGVTDVPVGKSGMETLNKAPVHPEVKRVFASPMLRTRQTAQALFPNAELVLADGLREINFGDFEGKSGEELLQHPDYRPIYERWAQSGMDLTFPNGESIDEVAERVTAAFDSVVNMAQEGERVYVVTHGGIIMALMSLFAGDREDYISFRVRNLHGYTAMLNKSEWKRNRKFASYRAYSALAEE